MCLCLLGQLTSQHWYVDCKLSSAIQAQSSTTLSNTLITLGFELEQVIISKVTLKVSTVKVENVHSEVLTHCQTASFASCTRRDIAQ